MGCTFSKQTHPQEDESKKGEATAEWKLMPSAEEARKKFEADGSLNKNSDPVQLELRALLEEPVAQRALGKYAKDKKALDIFMCWIDIQEYKSIPTEDYRRSKALHLYHKYIKEDSVLVVGGIDPAQRIRIKTDLDNSKANKLLLTCDYFDGIQQKCFLEIYSNIFIPFKNTPAYESLNRQVKQKYNIFS